RRARRLIGNDLVVSRLQSLEHRRKVACLAVFYKIHFGECALELFDLVKPSPFYHRTARHRKNLHRYVVEIPSTHILGRQNSKLQQWSNVIRSASQNAQKPKTAILMLNMGGPKTTDQVSDYLLRIMTDRDMIQLPVQSKLGPWIASRRTEEVKKKYAEIGGGSPIYKWTDLQGTLLTRALDQMLPESAPHKHYIAFRYVPPFTDEALTELEK
ncbi:jg25284, partial [Pararge aegeria aegeria]